MKKPFKLAPMHISNDVVEALTFLLEEATRGEVVGVAYVAQLKKSAFVVDTAGESHRDPLFSLGMVRILEEGLVHQVRYPEEAA
jgi:hypothetical protein